jgi:hypothetical protein
MENASDGLSRLGGITLKLSEAIELGSFLERPGSALSYKGCAIGLGMAAMGVPRKERTAAKAKELWPWLGHVSRTSPLGLTKIDYIRDISDWYFNVRLGRMTMAQLANRIRVIEPAERPQATEREPVASRER